MHTTPVRVKRLSFIGGSLRPKGTVANIKTAVLEGTTRDKSSEETTKFVRNSNVAPLDGSAGVVPVVAMAAIAPTGPNPTKPQQVPAGSISGAGGHFYDGAKLVAEGSEAEATQPGPGDVQIEGEVEEEAPSRQFSDDDEDEDEAGARAKAIVEGTVTEIERAVVGLSAEELDAVERAEAAGQKRAGVANAVKAARGNLHS